MADNSNGDAQSPLNLLGDNGNIHSKVISNVATGAIVTDISPNKFGDLPVFCVRSFYPGDPSQIVRILSDDSFPVFYPLV